MLSLSPPPPPPLFLRIVVSAPKGTASGGVPNTGLVYSCPINPGTCSLLPGLLVDTRKLMLVIIQVTMIKF